MPAPLPYPLLLPDALGLPLLLLGQALLLQTGNAFGRRIQVDAPRRFAQTIGQAPGAFRLPRQAMVW